MSKLCQCGCGLETRIAPKSIARLSVKKGEQYRFIPGHQRRVRHQLDDALPFKIDGKYCRFIPLPDRCVAIVEEEDYALLAIYSWYLKKNRDGKLYVVRKGLLEDGQRHCQVAMHRQILGLNPGDPREGDHANRNTLDNRRTGNLRIAIDSENARNARTRKDNTSGFKGVSRQGKVWRYRIWTDTKRESVSGFRTAQDAFDARCVRLPKEHREFARAS